MWTEFDNNSSGNADDDAAAKNEDANADAAGWAGEEGGWADFEDAEETPIDESKATAVEAQPAVESSVDGQTKAGGEEAKAEYNFTKHDLLKDSSDESDEFGNFDGPAT